MLYSGGVDFAAMAETFWAVRSQTQESSPPIARISHGELLLPGFEIRELFRKVHSTNYGKSSNGMRSFAGAESDTCESSGL
jgi:hypothetical protein